VDDNVQETIRKMESKLAADASAKLEKEAIKESTIGISSSGGKRLSGPERRGAIKAVHYGIMIMQFQGIDKKVKSHLKLGANAPGHSMQDHDFEALDTVIPAALNEMRKLLDECERDCKGAEEAHR
jgi:hypothetical protein